MKLYYFMGDQVSKWNTFKNTIFLIKLYYLMSEILIESHDLFFEINFYTSGLWFELLGKYTLLNRLPKLRQWHAIYSVKSATVTSRQWENRRKVGELFCLNECFSCKIIRDGSILLYSSIRFSKIYILPIENWYPM